MTEKLTEKQVVIFIRGTQFYEDAEPDESELITEGVMRLENSGENGEIEYVLEYEETELTGMEGTTTRFNIRGDTVVLTREGRVSSQIIFRRGGRSTSLYETPWGTMPMDVATTSLHYRLSERGGVLEIKYTVALDHQVTGMNEFKIRIKESMR